MRFQHDVRAYASCRRATASASIHLERSPDVPKVAPGRSFTAEPTGGSGSSGDGFTVARQIYRLTPLQAGRLSLTQKDFANLPKGTIVKSQTLEVK